MAPPLDLRILGRTLLHTAAVGLAAGLLGAAFFAGLEYTQSFLLEHLAGYAPLRAHGEKIFGEAATLVLRPAVILVLPAAGALLAGLLCILAPEARLELFVSGSSLACLATLGVLAARAGGAPVLTSTLRVAFWGALAMALTAGVGSLFGTTVG